MGVGPRFPNRERQIVRRYNGMSRNYLEGSIDIVLRRCKTTIVRSTSVAIQAFGPDQKGDAKRAGAFNKVRAAIPAEQRRLRLVAECRDPPAAAPSLAHQEDGFSGLSEGSRDNPKV